MDAKQRGQRIIEYLKEHKYADVSLLSGMLNVSEMTIRRDLDRLGKKNLLLRVHGGAQYATQRMYEPPLIDRLNHQAEEKYALGRYAASLVEEGDAIAIDSSSTTYAMLPYLNVEVTVVTNHINVAAALADNDKANVILLGGVLRKASMSLSGSDVADMMKKYFVDKVFLSAKAVDGTRGVSDATAAEAQTKQVLMKSAKQNFFLFDHTKINTTAFCHVCPLADIDHMIVYQQAEFTKQQKQLFDQYSDSRGVLHYA